MALVFLAWPLRGEDEDALVVRKAPGPGAMAVIERVDSFGIDRFQARTYRAADGKTMPYRLFVPEDYDAGNKYPLMVFLHGAGGRGNDNLKNISGGNSLGARIWTLPNHQQKYPAIVLAPQCPDTDKWANVNWGDLSHQQRAEPTVAMSLALAIIDEVAKEFSVDHDRIYITGQSMGGYGTWDAATRRPDFFAAAVPICGGADESKAATLTQLPIWAFHGDKDTTVKTVRSRNMIEAIQKAGGKPRYTEYLGVGHASWIPAYCEPELSGWLFAQRNTATKD